MQIMGILNVTPNSFSDGGKFLATHDAIEQGLAMMEAGADIVDIGGESTRPGAQRVSVEEEQARIIPVIKELSQHLKISVDTMNSATAKAAVEAGAHIINDVSGGLADEAMLATVASLEVPYIAMHWRAHSTQMDSKNQYQNVAQDVAAELEQRVDAADQAGIKDIILDPGLGFSKDVEQNWELLQNYKAIKDLGFPVLIGGSRKRFLTEFATGQEAESADAATLALTLWAQEQEAWGVRVHEVKDTVAAVKTWEKLHS